MRTLFGNPVVNRKRAEKREQHEYESRYRRKRLGREKCNPWLIAESREVVDSRQTHYLPPGVLPVRSCVFGILLSGTFE